ncbi:MAG TPA: hypothetical protein VMV14_04375 [Acidimicrobiales bacterium]|nr:hypothetical protein [Acidimicrobiales bacterium]
MGGTIVVHERQHGFDIEVSSAGRTTRHEVTVSAGFADRLGLGHVPPVELVRASFEFLLEREPASSILSTFDLEVIARYFPEYPAVIARRFGGG